MANKGLDNKISNIIGTKVPQWLIQQFDVRADRNSDDVRSNQNLVYLANKSSWVRLVSSVDIDQDRDQEYFSRISGLNINNAQELSKNFVLFGGTSKYKEGSSYDLRSGVSFSDPNKIVGGAYGMLGKEEIQKYGYKPMPGITSVNIETQGRLGSIKAAIVNFKCWDKAQLDIIDALYFKLGFTMFLEWGHTYFYTSDQPDTLKSSEDYSIVDPFRFIKIQGTRGSGIYFNAPNKEEIYAQISKSARESEGNYDAMLGMVTNFNFTYNQDGGYDCTLRLMGLGFLGESIKINNPATLPNLLTEEIVLLSNTLKLLDQQDLPSDDPKKEEPFPDAKPNDLLQFLAIEKIVNYDIENTAYRNRGYKTYEDILQQNKSLFDTISFTNYNEVSKIALRDFNNIVRKMTDVENAFIFAPSNFNRQVKSDVNPNLNFRLSSNEYYQVDFFANDQYVIGNKNVILSPNNTYKNISLDLSYLKRRYDKFISDSNTQLRDPQLPGFDVVTSNSLGLGLLGRRNVGQTTTYFSIGYKSPTYDQTGPGSGDLNLFPATYFFTIAIDRQKYTESGTLLKNGLASDNEVYEVLLNILNSSVLSVDSLSSASNPYVKSDVFKNSPFYLLTDIINDNLPYAFGVSLKQKLNNKQKISVKDPNVSEVVEGNVSFSERIKQAEEAQKGVTPSEQYIDTFLKVGIVFNDSSLFYSIDPVDNNLKLNADLEAQAKLIEQNKLEAAKKEQQRLEQEALINQISNSLSYQSALELTLRTIQVHALTRAIYSSEKPDKNIGNKVFVLKMTDKPKERDFLTQIFSNGIFSPFIETLVDNINSIQLPQDIADENVGAEDRLKIYAKYGFLSSLLGNKASYEQIKDDYVDYSKLLTAFVIPYRINQELVAGVKTNHPVYIPFGLLLMLLNHICTMYDSKTGSSSQTPLVYIDYNPNLNFFLSNYQQLSTDPFKVLIPFEGTDEDYKDLFYTEVLTKSKTAIRTNPTDEKGVPLFKPSSQDLISFKLQEYCPIKFSDDNNGYRGRLMNILLSIDYLTDLVKQYSRRDGSNNVYLKPFIEEILTTINKCTGNFNSFRLSYNDSSNTFQIVDDQVVPTLKQEIMLTPFSDQRNPTNRTEIPLIGKTSIAKSIETRTEISSKLGSLVAISANPVMKDKSTLSTNGDSLGFMNTDFSDRYVTNRLAIGEQNAESRQIESRVVEAITFNSTITDFYSSANPSDADVPQATSYYIEKMSKIKNEQSASLASSMVPIGINFTTDGIGGLNIGQAFTVNDEILPYSYTKKFRPGYIDNYNKYVGFAIIGLSHTIENNQWNTSVRTNMIAVKDKTVYEQKKITKLPVNEAQFSTSEAGNVDATKTYNVNNYKDKLNIAIPFFKNNLKFSDIATAAAIGNLIQESGLNYQAWNIGATVGQVTTIEAGSSKNDTLTDPKNLTFTGRGFQNREITAYGIAQWTSDRKKAYIKFRDANGGDSLQTQLKFLQSELNSTYKNSVLESMKLKDDLVSAVSTWLKNYEKIEADLQQRVAYANGVLDYIKRNNL